MSPQRCFSSLGRPGVVGQGGDRARVHAAVGDEVAEPLGQHPGLARSGRGDHPGRPRCGDRPRPAGPGRARQRVDGGRPGSRRPASAFQRWTTPIPGRWAAVGGTAVDVQRRAVGEDDVGRATFGHAVVGRAAGGLAAVPPDRRPRPGRRSCWPRRGSAAARGELEVRRELVDRTVATLRRPEGGGVHAQLNHNRSTIDPVAVEILYYRPRVSRARRPRRRHGGKSPRPRATGGRGEPRRPGPSRLALRRSWAMVTMGCNSLAGP